MDYRLVCMTIFILSIVLITALYFVARDNNQRREDEIHHNTENKLKSFLGGRR